MKHWIVLVASLALLAEVAAPDPAFGADTADVPRVVAIGDVHWKLDAFVTILE